MANDIPPKPEIPQQDLDPIVASLLRKAEAMFQEKGQRGHLHACTPDDLVHEVVMLAIQNGELQDLAKPDNQSYRLHCHFVSLLRRVKVRRKHAKQVFYHQSQLRESNRDLETVDEEAGRLTGRLTRDDAAFLIAHHKDKTDAAAKYEVTRGTAGNRASKIIRQLRLALERARAAIVLIDEYVTHLEQGLIAPSGPFVSMDLTGNGDAFYNWPSNESFIRVLEVTSRYSAFGGALRIFLIDPKRITDAYLHNFKRTLLTHIRHGVHVGVIDREIPKCLCRDIAIFGRQAVDFGHLEYQGATRDMGLQSCYYSSTDTEFDRIRLALNELKRIARIVEQDGQINDTILYLTRHIPQDRTGSA